MMTRTDCTDERCRRGIVLLFVLALLALFSLILVAFVIVTSQAKRGARFAAEIERHGTPPQELLERAFLQIVRGSTNPHSAIGPHSLLEDLYGNDQVRSKVVAFQADGASASQVGGNAFLAFEVDPSQFRDSEDASDPGAKYFGYYNGRVITMLTGPCAGQSSRITNYLPIGGRMLLYALPFAGMRPAASGGWTPDSSPRSGDGFLINGRPFNGTGFGLDIAKANSGSLDWKEVNNFLLGASYTSDKDGFAGNSFAYALLPNPARFAGTTNYPTPDGPGGADEDYDAPDYQNMLLAMRVSPPDSESHPQTHLPSLHRPDLINYWAHHWKPGATGIVDEIPQALLGRIMLRPNHKDHPKFAANNPDFDPVREGKDANGDGIIDQFTWDVDNDGDGQTDSVWVDVGFPVETSADGRRYKPLVAVLCVDMDGKLNLNAHGNSCRRVLRRIACE